jgi:hypothetical protein
LHSWLTNHDTKITKTQPLYNPTHLPYFVSSAALLFKQHGLQKLLLFPAPSEHGTPELWTLVWFGGWIEAEGGALLALGLLRRTMRTFEFRVYKLRTKEALEFYIGEIYPRHLKSFPLFGIEAHGFWTAGRMSSHGSSCWSPMRRAKNPATSLGGICKAQNSLTTSETLMFPTSWVLNQRS